MARSSQPAQRFTAPLTATPGSSISSPKALLKEIEFGWRVTEPTAFAVSLRAHMDEWSAGMCRRPPMWAQWTDGIHREYRGLAERVRVDDEVKLHDYGRSPAQLSGVRVQPVPAVSRRQAGTTVRMRERPGRNPAACRRTTLRMGAARSTARRTRPETGRLATSRPRPSMSCCGASWRTVGAPPFSSKSS